MKKQEIIKIIQDVRNKHSAWVAQGDLLADSINLDSMIEPEKHSESDLYIWLESNEMSLSAFSWYKELGDAYSKLHRNYSDLFYSAMRKYNPKTRDELLEEYKSVKQELVEFNEKIDEIEKEVVNMSDVAYLDYVLKSNAETRKAAEKNKLKNKKNSKNESSLKTQHNNKLELDSDETPSDVIAEVNADLKDDPEIKSKPSKEEIEALEEEQIKATDVSEEIEVNQQDMQELDIEAYDQASDEIFDEPKIEVVDVKTKDLDTEKNTKYTIESKSAFKNLSKHISLKEQHIKQLNQEKELTQLELRHLEEIQKLSQQGIDQLEQNLNLKQQEIELDQLDNQRLLELNTEAKENTTEQLSVIEEKKVVLKNEIIHLEEENIKDQLQQEEFKKTSPIEKQFESLKKNKNKELDKLQQHLGIKKSALIKLREQVLSLESEISEIEEDINNKQHDITDLVDKECEKNEERSIKIEKQEKNIKQRMQTIDINNQELDTLEIDEKAAQKELNELNISFGNITKSLNSIAENNKSEIESIELQQLKRQEKLTEIYNQKLTKQEELEALEISLKNAEDSLGGLSAELEKIEDETVLT